MTATEQERVRTALLREGIVLPAADIAFLAAQLALIRRLAEQVADSA